MSKVYALRKAGTGLSVFLLLVFLVSSQTQAATMAEIIAMSDAGVPPDVIIDVIDATGMDDNPDADNIGWLLDSGIDDAVLEFILINYYIEDDIDIDQAIRDSEIQNDARDNWAGGSYHEGTGYIPMYQSSGNDRFSYDRNNGLGGIYIYEPPVYVLDNHPYYRAWQVPRTYGYADGYSNGPGYIIYGNEYYNPYSYSDPWGYDPYWTDWDEDGRWYDNRWHHHDGWSGSLFGDWRYNGHRNRYDIGGSAWYHSDGLRLRISF